MKKILNILLNRIFVVAMLLILQIAWLVLFMTLMVENFRILDLILTALSILVVLWLVNKRINPAYKLIWTIVILIVPIFGVTFYLLTGKSRIARKIQRELERVYEGKGEILKQDDRVWERLALLNPLAAKQSRYIKECAGYPVYQNTSTEYFPVGEDWFEVYLEELQKAEHFIFMEYFIIADGYLWDKVLGVLEQKVKEGVDVRLIYDDVGCLTTLPHRFYKKLQEKGIKCAAFNPFRPLLNIILNNRDHRKITVIDGHTAFTGGVNLADEYINQKERFGHWKDSGLMCRGEAAWSFTVMFLQMWCAITQLPYENFEDYRPHRYHKEVFPSDGFVQPYSDTPLDDETVGENVYLNIIGSAKKYVYIFTPYLILDNETMTALCLAARSGIDVRIMTPRIPDKKLVFLLSQSYYEQLLEAGVRIYEYTPGFIHSKCFICDDEIAAVGTFNLDYRSLYLHFENGCWMYKSRAVLQVKEDTLDTMHLCGEEMTLEFCRGRNIAVRALQSVLRLFSPML